MENKSHHQPDFLDVNLHPEISRVRSNASGYLTELSSMGLIRSMQGQQERVRPLDYIGMSACFLVPSTAGADLVKLRTYGTPGEAETLLVWEASGVSVPKVKKYGVLPSTQTSDSPFKVSYMIQEAILDEHGNPAPTAEDVLAEHPDLIEQVGTTLGKELALIHAIPANNHPYGSVNEADRWNSSADSWGGVLEDQLQRQAQHLSGLGFSGVEIARITAVTASLPFSDEKRYIHNDFNPHNSLVPTRDPLKIVIIDPNPMVGDRHWDLAYVANKKETSAKRNEINTTNGLDLSSAVADSEERYAAAFFAAYGEESGVSIDSNLLLACQLPRSLRSYDFFVSRSAGQFGSLNGNTRFEAIKQTVRSQANRMLLLR